MIFKQETQILKCTFEKEHFSKVKAAFKAEFNLQMQQNSD